MKQKKRHESTVKSGIIQAIFTEVLGDDGLEKIPFGGYKAKIPIHFEGREIGNVDLIFNTSSELFSSLDNNPTLSRLRGNTAAYEFAIYRIFSHFEEAIAYDVELALKNELDAKEESNIPFLVYMFYFPEVAGRTDLKDFVGHLHDSLKYEQIPYLIQEEKVLELVKSSGPLALRQGAVQYALTAWLGDKEIASEKIGKLKDALMIYTYGSLDKPLKIGRPKVKALQTPDVGWVLAMYKEIAEVLKIAKRKAILLKKDWASNKLGEKDMKFVSDIEQLIMDAEADVSGGIGIMSRPEALNPAKAARLRLKTEKLKSKAALIQGNQLGVFINEAYLEYISKLETNCKDKSALEENTRERLNKLVSLRDLFPVLSTPLAAILKSDGDLEGEFRNLRFEPNKLAKEIVARLLGISVSKLEKTLY